MGDRLGIPGVVDFWLVVLLLYLFNKTCSFFNALLEIRGTMALQGHSSLNILDIV